MTTESSGTLEYWPVVRPPHKLALPNLRKLAEYMGQHGYTNHNRTISLYRLARETNTSIPQVTNLIADRPGFVAVYINNKRVGFYFDTTLGTTYPESFSKEAVLKSESFYTDEQTAIKAAQVVNSEVARAAATTPASHNVMALADTIKVDDGVYGFNEIAKVLRLMLDAVKTGEREPNVPGTFFYSLAQKIQAGTVTITDD